MATATGKGLALLEERLTARATSEGVGFDPTIILLLISVLLPLIQSCFAPKPAALRRRFGNRARVAAALRRESLALTWAECFRHADGVLDLAEAATDEELQSLIDDCCSER